MFTKEQEKSLERFKYIDRIPVVSNEDLIEMESKLKGNLDSDNWRWFKNLKKWSMIRNQRLDYIKELRKKSNIIYQEDLESTDEKVKCADMFFEMLGEKGVPKKVYEQLPKDAKEYVIMNGYKEVREELESIDKTTNKYANS